jgi:colanic acid biosynthesis glycosyl transferase WcaI
LPSSGRHMHTGGGLQAETQAQMGTKDRPLSVLIVSQYFSPEAFGINALVAELQERGHSVTVLTGMPNYPSGVFVDGYGGWKVQRETWKNASVIRIPIFARGQNSRLRLALNYLSFAVNASILAPFLVKDRPNVILVYQMSPVTMALPAIIVKLFTRSKILLWVQDIWPESLVATGAVKGPIALVTLRLIVRIVYRCSSVIAVQSRQFEKFIRPLALPADIRYLPNTADRFYRPIEVPLDAPERKLFRPGFNILFAGNLGLAQDLETVLAAIRHLKDRKDIQWIFVGDGRRRAWLQHQIHELGLADNVQILGSFPPERMPCFFAIADVLLITLRDEPIFSLTVPSKLQTYLACGRPVLGAISGEAADILIAAGAGLTAPPNDPERLAEMALTMAQMPVEQLKALGDAALAYHGREFDRDQWLDCLESWLQELSTPPGRGTR